MLTKVAVAFLLLVSVASVSSYDIHVPRLNLHSDLQLAGFQGQTFSIQAETGSVFNIISTPTFQMNALAEDLTTGGLCAEAGMTNCTAYPGTFLTKVGFMVGGDEVIVVSGSASEGMTVSVNGKSFTLTNIPIMLGAPRTAGNSTLELVSASKLILSTDSFTVVLVNKDNFFSMSVALKDKSLLVQGRKENFAFNAGSRYLNHIAATPIVSQVAMHGLLGQTWANVVYPNLSNNAGGKSYDGVVADYKLASSSLTGTDFTYNQYATVQA